MPPRTHWLLGLIFGICLLFSACGRETSVTSTPASPGPAAKAEPLRDAIPADRISAVLAANSKGLGLMEQYDYKNAAEAFREVRRLAPGWIAGSINLAIALLNDAGAAAESSGQKKEGQTSSNPKFDEALALLDDVLKRDPNNLHAHYCRALIYHFLWDPNHHPDYLARAHEDFLFVAEHDPTDGHAWFKVGDTLLDPDSVGQPGGPRPAGPKQAKEQIRIYTKALECNPYLVPALFKLQTAYRLSGDQSKARELSDLWDRLNPERHAAAPGEMVKDFYGDAGRYAWIIDPNPSRRAPAGAMKPPRFDTAAPIQLTLPEGHHWATESDFQKAPQVFTWARAAFGAAIASFDADGDGRQDLYLAAAVGGPKGLHDILLRNKGDGRFEDATAAFGLPDDRASLGVAAGDFDADRHIDLVLTGVGDNRLYRNVAGKRFEDMTQKAGIAGPAAVSLTARWLDLDMDGDLDLYVVNYCRAEDRDAMVRDRPCAGLPNAAYRNDGKPAPVPNVPAPNLVPVGVVSPNPALQVSATEGLSIAFSPWSGADDLLGGSANHTGLAALDLDDDRDLDLVLAAQDKPPTAVLNDRLGRFHAVPLDDLGTPARITSLLVADLDKDGRPDLVSVGQGGRVVAWRNTTQRAGTQSKIDFATWPVNATDWHLAQVADIDLDGWSDLLGLPASEANATIELARNEGDRLAKSKLALGPEADQAAPLRGFAYADFVGDPLPDLVLVREGSRNEGLAPRVARNLGNGHHWLALDLAGCWRNSPWNRMRTNPQAIGARVALEGDGLDVRHEHTTPTTGLAQSAGPVVLGLGERTSAALVRVRWPDGVMQCELNVEGGQKLALAEFNRRKEGSCPVLFTWNGERFVCIGDFLGGGGLGYLIAPDVYSQPDRDEAVAIGGDQLRAVEGHYALAITEPMDELAYLDQLILEVVDRPPGVSTGLDERFVPSGRRPSGQVVAWKTTIEPVRVTDLKGRDVTEALRAFDRRTVDDFQKLSGWIGYAEEHGIILDFGDRLARFGPNDRLLLALAGWVEYPYSQTNYAASTAGIALRPPVLERQRDDGSWEIIEPNPGYPAGLPRLTTLDLTGKLTGPRCVLRLRTNLECYWDQAFIALREANLGVRVTPLSAARAVLGYRGYTREVSPDGRPPLLYDYDHIDPAPLARLAGPLTRYGDVASLLREDDDHLCLVGPGDEVRLEFDASSVPALPEGWNRSYVLRAVGYCKDADPFTATSDTAGPLPWRGMPAFPFGPEGRRPEDPSYRAYLRDFQTRESSSH
jgi:tetratricopeptide (TPR) repeat protein